jgi:hypothetical protein
MNANDYAIVIGINKYTNHYGNIDSLEYAVNDAHSIRDFLEKDIGIKNVHYFTDDCPEFPTTEKEGIVSREVCRPNYINLSCFFSNKFEEPFLNVENKLWFFFSGHAQRINGKHYLMASDSKNLDPEYAIDIDFITGKLRESGAGDIIMFIDACRNKVAKGKGDSVKPKKQRGVITFYSCDIAQQSFEDSRIKHGIFTKVLLDALSGDNNCATVERLDRYLQKHVAELSKSLVGNIQHPCLRIEPLVKSKLIILEKIATEEDFIKCPKQNMSKLHLTINKIFFNIRKYKEKYKVQFSISYVTSALLIAIPVLTITGLLLTPTFYSGFVQLMIGGEKISWQDSTSINKLNPKFKWFPGTRKNSIFKILPGNVLRITAAPGTEYWRKISDDGNLPPVMSFPVDRDFEATVKVTLNSTISFQRAYFGVRDSQKRYRQIVTYLMENSMVESAQVEKNIEGANNDNTEIILKPTSVKSNGGSVYFKIRKYQNNFNLSYSENGINWQNASNSSSSIIATFEKCEIFFSAISTREDESTTADFSDFSINFI